MRLGNAFHLSRAVQVAARMDLGRLPEKGSRTLDELCEITGTNPSALQRFLRFLAELGVVKELSQGRFGPTPLSGILHLIDNVAQGQEAWAAWSHLPDSLRTGEPVFEAVHGMPFYEYVARHPEQQRNWDEWNVRMGRPQFAAMARLLDLQGDETVVDSGGGQGDLLIEILQTYPKCQGILLDLPDVVREAPRNLREARVEDRCRVVPGSAFDEVPKGGDVYLLTRVLMNWADEPAPRLLTRCREVMAPGARLWIVETLMPEPGDPRRRFLAGHDLNLFLLWGGRHRTREEMTRLLKDAKLEPGEIRDEPGLGLANGGSPAGIDIHLVKALKPTRPM